MQHADLSHGTWLVSPRQSWKQTFRLKLLLSVSELYRAAQPVSSFNCCRYWNGFVKREWQKKSYISKSLSTNLQFAINMWKIKLNAIINKTLLTLGNMSLFLFNHYNILLTWQIICSFAACDVKDEISRLDFTIS